MRKSVNSNSKETTNGELITNPIGLTIVEVVNLRRDQGRPGLAFKLDDGSLLYAASEYAPGLGYFVAIRKKGRGTTHERLSLSEVEKAMNNGNSDKTTYNEFAGTVLAYLDHLDEIGRDHNDNDSNVFRLIIKAWEAYRGREIRKTN